MFEQTQARTRSPWTVGVSLSLQCLAVGIVLLLPLLHPENLRMPGPPQPKLIRTWITQPPLPPQQRTAIHTSSASLPSPARAFVYRPPTHDSTTTPSIEVPMSDAGPVAWASPVGQLGPALTGSVALPQAVKPKAAEPASPKSVPSGPIHVSSGVTAAKLVFGPAPVYPRIAVTAGSQGIVKLEATIAEDGSIRDLRVVSGPPLLVNAALDAVRQWRYHPTLLNGTAVQVLTEIDVNFTLSR
jgi:protein TonB